MRIENLRESTVGDRARVSADMVWEDNKRPVEEIFFETSPEFAKDLTCNPHAFLLASIVPAMYFGEKRVAIDAEICPELKSGIITAMSWLRLWWYDPRRELVTIEAGLQDRTGAEIRAKRSGFFYSGGVDSFATLRRNRLDYPKNHPGSMKDGLFVYGLELDNPDTFDCVLASLSNAANQLNITLIPVYTNIYLKYRKYDAAQDFRFWIQQVQGAVFAAIAHAFSNRFSRVSIASTNEIPSLYMVRSKHIEPYGTHPLLDPSYASSDLKIVHDGCAYSRLNKVELLADWDVALQNLRVCNHTDRYKPNELNCGKCEKCVRTMLALLATGALNKANVFQEVTLTPEKVLKTARLLPLSVDDYGRIVEYMQLIEPLEKIGREDLAVVVRDAVRRAERVQQRLAQGKTPVSRLESITSRIKRNVLRRLRP